MLRLVAGCALVAIVAGLCPATELGAQVASPATALFTRYRTGDRVAVVASMAAVADDQIDVLVRDVRRRAAEWVRQGRSTDRARLDVATFLLEMAGARLEVDWRAVRELVEVGCRLLDPIDPPSDPLRRWHFAALALAQGAADTGFLLSHVSRDNPQAFDHLAHSVAKFPLEARFRLAEVVVGGMGRSDLAPPRDLLARTDAELMEMPGIGRSEMPLRQARLQVLGALQLLTDVAPVAAEAHLRSGHLASLLYDDDTARRHLTVAISSSEDPFILFNAYLLRGILERRTGHSAAAEAALRQALRVVPLAQSAVGLLSAELYLTGREDEAHDMVDAWFTHRPRAVDPWRLFGYGDFRRWPALIADLRRDVSQ